MEPSFVHLHTHSHYSLLDGLSKVPALVKQAKKYGMSALAITDHGNLYGAIEFYKTCHKEGIKPIIGVEAYIANRTRFDKEPGIDNRRYHLTLLAYNVSGYKNLIKLVTAANLEGYYYKPRMDKDLLREYHDGIICLSGCMGGELSRTLQSGNKEHAAAVAREYQDIFGAENYFIEIMHHPTIEGHEKLNSDLVELSRTLTIPLVGTQDSHYLSRDDKKAHATLLAIQTGGDIGESDLFKEDEDFSFISADVAREYFKDTPEAVDNTLKIAERCDIALELGTWVFPNISVEGNLTHDEALARLVEQGLSQRRMGKTPEVAERIRYELEVISNKGYSPYFLVVSDLLRFARTQGILTTTRGSAAGSLVSYLSGITNVDPMEYQLPFERFLNPYRPSPPDIDMDFADNRRDEVIEYARQKYGNDRVAQIGTFGTMLARGVVRDVARALGHPYSVGDSIARLIPMGSQGFPMTIDRAMEMEPELKKMYTGNATVREVIDLGKKLEGCVRHVSVHAAGVVIAPSPLTDFVPTQLDPKGGKIITQYDMNAVEDAGLLKFDFLGIRNLAILSDSVAIVKKSRNIEVDIENIPLDDSKTFTMLAQGKTMGLFQLNGTAMTRYLKELRPTSVHDINAMVALYRPGPMNNIPEYIARKQGRRPVTYYHPKMKSFLEKSYGILVYQDDLLFTALEIAGYNWEEVDKFRKAVGKKIPEEMAKQHQIFVQGCIKHSGMNEKQAEGLWDLFEPFQGYGFNKCLTGDTRIVDARSGAIHTIEYLYKKREHMPVFTLTGNLKLESRTTEAIMKNGRKKVYCLQTRTGKKITATGNHPFYTIDGWKNLIELSAGIRVATARAIPLARGKTAPFYEAASLGYLLSEGNLCHPHGVYFYSKSQEEIDDFVTHCSQFRNARVTLDTSKSAVSVYVGQKNQRHGNALKKWLEELGLTGKTATKKFVPAAVFEWDIGSIACFLGKLWQGDGAVSIKNQQLFYATSSEQLARDAQHLLLRFGIISTIHKKAFRYRGTYKQGFTVTITHRVNIQRFAETIGEHLIGQKKEQLDILAKAAERVASVYGQYPARGTKDTIPAAILSSIRLCMAEQSCTPKMMAQSTGIAERLFMYDKEKSGYQRETLAIVGNALASSEILNYAQSDIYWDEIVSITETGTAMTYDLTVPPHHNFVANDFIVHNSHAASYGKVAYQTAYMKAIFPLEYMTAVLTADSGDSEKVPEIIAECKRMGIAVLPPDINESFGGFTSIDEGAGAGKIRFGLSAIKNFGEGIAETIIKERTERGRFASLADFLERVQDRNLNKKSLEALIMCGALDAFGERGTMLKSIDALLAYHKECAQTPSQQVSLFGDIDTGVKAPALTLEGGEPAPAADRLRWEKELLGLYISGHPLDSYREKLEARKTNINTMKKELREGMLGVAAGLVSQFKQVVTKRGDKMLFASISDFSGDIEVVVFPKTLAEFRDLLQEERCVAIKGRMSERNGGRSLIAETVRAL